MNKHAQIIGKIIETDEWKKLFIGLPNNIDYMNVEQLRYLHRRLWKNSRLSFAKYYEIPPSTFNEWYTSLRTAYVAEKVRDYLKNGDKCDSIGGCICQDSTYEFVDESALLTIDKIKSNNNRKILVLIDGSNLKKGIIKDLSYFENYVYVLIVKNINANIDIITNSWINVINTYTSSESAIDDLLTIMLYSLCGNFNKIIIIGNKTISNEAKMFFKSTSKSLEIINTTNISLILYLIYSFNNEDFALINDSNILDEIRDIKFEMIKIHKYINELQPKTYKQFLDYVKTFYIKRLFGINAKTFANTLVKFHDWNSAEKIVTMVDNELKDEVEYCLHDPTDLYYCYDVDLEILSNWLNNKCYLDQTTKQKLITWINER